MPSPLDKSKEQYKDLIGKISSPDSPVGIDASYTHAVIINYLQQITDRLDKLEEDISKLIKS
jgi:hypothetical protein